jgi:rRNA-processing protein FCF1
VAAARASGELPDSVVVVLEGKARDGVAAGEVNGVHVIHAPASGDDKLVELVSEATEQVTVVTADRGLRERVEALGADVVGPSWLIERIEESS